MFDDCVKTVRIRCERRYKRFELRCQGRWTSGCPAKIEYSLFPVHISAQSSTEDHVSSTSITFQPHYRVKPTSVSLLQGLPFRWYLSQYPGDMAAITPIAEPAPAAGGQNGEET